MNGNKFAEDQVVLCGGRPYTVAAVARDKAGYSASMRLA